MTGTTPDPEMEKAWEIAVKEDDKSARPDLDAFVRPFQRPWFEAGWQAKARVLEGQQEQLRKAATELVGAQKEWNAMTDDTEKPARIFNRLLKARAGLADALAASEDGGEPGEPRDCLLVAWRAGRASAADKLGVSPRTFEAFLETEQGRAVLRAARENRKEPVDEL